MRKIYFLISFLFGGVTFSLILMIWGIIIGAHVEYPDRINEDRLFETVNMWRKENGFSELEKSLSLCGYAHKRAKDSKINWSHDPFWGDLPNLQKELKYQMLGENLSNGFNSEQEVLANWLNSPPHRENLEKKYTHSCIKCENDYCAQIFAEFLIQ